MQQIIDHLKAILIEQHWTHPDVNVEIEEIKEKEEGTIDYKMKLIRIHLKILNEEIISEPIPTDRQVYIVTFLKQLEVAKSILTNYAIQAIKEGYKISELNIKEPDYNLYFVEEETRGQVAEGLKTTYENMLMNYKTLNITKNICQEKTQTKEKKKKQEIQQS